MPGEQGWDWFTGYRPVTFHACPQCRTTRAVEFCAGLAAYEALKEAGATEEKAAAAAEAIHVVRQDDLRRIEDRLTGMEDRLRAVERDLADVKADVRLMKWMLGFLLALAVANLWLLIRG